APPCVFSSAFPRAGDVCLFPTPLEVPPLPKPGAPKYKDVKKCRYVSPRVFNALIAGESLVDWLDKDKDKVQIQSKAVLLDPSEKNQLPPHVRNEEKIWSIEKRPRVTVGRAVTNSQIFHVGQVVFHKDCGLWFAVRWLRRDPDIEQLVTDALTDLGEVGLGGERSVGLGKAKIERQGTLELPDVTGAHWVTLSRYLPNADEMDALGNGIAYTIQTIPGWVWSPTNKSERRRTVQMIAEGAVLGRVARAVPGQIVDVQPDYEGTRPLGHPVWRNGRALAVGYKEAR
ncbi:MAG: type III-A CRISPR-associated RAMP protein Csm4, partial [Anaerolineae bacterium]|nr:type III-A CRISPR-associated RAMP protein Csm4 [Anaerolineae bacterium]